MKPITKGVLKGGIQTVELFQGVLIGYLVKLLYEKIDSVHEEETRDKVHKLLDIIIYVFILLSCAFIVREFNIILLKKTIIKKMNYKIFAWPPPVMLGFGLLLFQDSLKNKIKNELDLNTIH